MSDSGPGLLNQAADLTMDYRRRPSPNAGALSLVNVPNPSNAARGRARLSTTTTATARLERWRVETVRVSSARVFHR